MSAPTLLEILPIVAIETVDPETWEQRPEFSSSVREYFGNEHHVKLVNRITTLVSDAITTFGKDEEMSDVSDYSGMMGVYTVNKEQFRQQFRRFRRRRHGGVPPLVRAPS